MHRSLAKNGFQPARSTVTRQTNLKVSNPLLPPPMILILTRRQVPVTRVEGDEESLLRHVERNSLDAVVSCLSLHWVNDLPGTAPAFLVFTSQADLIRRRPGSNQGGSKA